MCSIIMYTTTTTDGKPTMRLELWGASTKHPDVTYCFEDFEKSSWISDECNIFQWLLECASRLSLPFSATQIAEFALENWVIWHDDCPNKDFKFGMDYHYPKKKES